MVLSAFRARTTRAVSKNDDCDSGICAKNTCINSYVWSQHYGGTGSLFAAGVAVDVFGNTALVGSLRGTADLGGGQLTSAGADDFLVAHFDPNGQHQWSKRFGGASNQTPVAVAVDDSGRMVVAGSLEGAIDFGQGTMTSAGGRDILVASFSLNGDAQWSRRYGDAQDQFATSIAIDKSGNSFVVGAFYGTAGFGASSWTAPGRSAFLVKLSPVGNPLWSKPFGDVKGATAFGVATDASGNVVITGTFEGTIDLGSAMWTNKSATTGSGDIFVAKFDPSGTPLWSAAFGDANADTGTSIAADAAGNVFVAGTFGGTVEFGNGPLTSIGGLDIFVLKMDTSGKVLWSRRFGGVQDEGSPQIATDGLGGVTLTASFLGTIEFGGGPSVMSAGDTDVMVLKLDASGKHVWSKAFGDVQKQVAKGIAVKGMSHVIVTGDYAGSINFGGGQLAASGMRDIFLAELLTP
ncbi:MAG: SBBP repeat-containing protein [Minicystis sp.]